MTATIGGVALQCAPPTTPNILADPRQQRRFILVCYYSTLASCALVYPLQRISAGRRIHRRTTASSVSPRTAPRSNAPAAPSRGTSRRSQSRIRDINQRKWSLSDEARTPVLYPGLRHTAPGPCSLVRRSDCRQMSAPVIMAEGRLNRPSLEMI